MRERYVISRRTKDFPPGGARVSFTPGVKEVSDWSIIGTKRGVWKTRVDCADVSGRAWVAVVSDGKGFKVFPDVLTEVVRSIRQKAIDTATCGVPVRAGVFESF